MGASKCDNESMPVARVLRKTGLLGDSKGIINRYIESEGAWNSHLDQCKHLIKQCVESRKVDNLAVYGSGWLLDLPIDRLSEVCGHVWLYDVVHPPQIRHKIRRYTNVTLVSADVTGGSVDWAYRAARKYKKDKLQADSHALITRPFVPMATPDYVISLNILSQLGEVIAEFLVRNGALERDQIEGLQARIQQEHLQQLPKGRSLLISDVCEYLVFEADSLSEYPLVFCPLPSHLPVAEWIWFFDPGKTYNSGVETRLKVKAWYL